MKKRKIFLLLFLLILFSCENKKKREINKQIQELDIIESVNKTQLDSIIKIKERIAVGNINFGIDKLEYVKEKKKFIKETNGRLGDFEFEMKPDFYDDNRGLRHLRLYGEKRNYNYSKKNILNDYSALKSILKIKYGAPTSSFIYNNSPISEWKIGNKSVRLSIIEFEDRYKSILLLHFKYQTTKEKIKIKNDIIKRKKISIEKAVDNL